MANAAQVPDKVLEWLHRSLSREYHHVQRTYSDVARALSYYPSLSPRTEVYTFENGASALLLLLQGTLPVSFRGTTYRFPIASWIPHSYPRAPPMTYVTPTRDLAVRPGQHVSVEGRIYHPYLVAWGEQGKALNLLDLLSVFTEAFAREPPVVSRQQQVYAQQQRRPNGSSPELATRPPYPGSNPRTAHAPSPRVSQGPRPPPPPPKPPEASNDTVYDRYQRRSSPKADDTAPPLPPKAGAEPSPSGSLGVDRYSAASVGPSAAPSRDRSAPLESRPPPPLPTQTSLSPGHEPPSMWQRDYRIGPNQTPTRQPSLPPSQMLSHMPQPRAQTQQPSLQTTTRPPQPYQVKPDQHLQQQPKSPQQDLLSLPLPTTDPSTIPAPPIPPNPEKDALLRTISSQLLAHLHQTVSQNRAAVPALQAQQSALANAQYAMRTEMQQLQELNASLNSNERILRESMAEAERTTEEWRKREVPAVDDVLVAPTAVGEQLYGLVAEEKGVEEAMRVLGRALDRGRVTGDVFVRQTRALAREQFLQKALIKKIARGMGLAMP